MATTFGGSRLANLREKRTSGEQSSLKKEQSLKLTMQNDESDEISYQPSTNINLNRTQTRLLKGRIERSGAEKEGNLLKEVDNENCYEPNTTINSRQKLTLSGGQTQQLKLVINDDTSGKEQRRSSVEQNPMRTTQKRILIAKEPEKQKEKEIEKPVEQVKPQTLTQTAEIQPEKPIIFNEDQPIKEEDIEESMPGESDLVECPQGCGRKFNRKALEKHAKACKLVFMSKRKEFNSEAKRLVNKEQAAIVKQQKDKQKKQKMKGGTKVFQKTSDNWKAASEDFRAQVKAIKKETVDQEQEDNREEEKEEMKILTCKYCEKPFAEVFLDKHLQVCAKKKETDRKKTFKKK